MSSKITINGLADAIQKELENYSEEVTKKTKKIVDDVSSELLNNTKNDAPVNTGKYKKSMSIKTEHENKYGKQNVWYVKKPHYRLTHLLEYGHVKVGGGRVEAQPHIGQNAENAIEELQKRIEEAVK